MIVYEAKLEGTQQQYQQLDVAIRTGRFVRNSIIRAWMDKQIRSRNEAYKYCKVLADNPEFPWAKKLNSMARQAHAEARIEDSPVVEDDDLRVRAALGISRAILS